MQAKAIAFKVDKDGVSMAPDLAHISEYENDFIKKLLSDFRENFFQQADIWQITGEKKLSLLLSITTNLMLVPFHLLRKEGLSEENILSVYDQIIAASREILIKAENLT